MSVSLNPTPPVRFFKTSFARFAGAVASSPPKGRRANAKASFVYGASAAAAAAASAARSAFSRAVSRLAGNGTSLLRRARSPGS